MDEQKLELLLLGPVHISIAGRPVTGLVSLKAKALLAYLAVERCAIARSDLAGLLWSDFPEEAARRNLRVEISKLRQDLDRYLVFTRQEARLKPDAHFQIDVHEFEDNLAALHKNRPLPDLKRLAQAAALYRGDFLHGLQMRDAPLLDDWLLMERVRLRQAAVELLDALVRSAIEHQDYPTGLAAVRKSLTIDNLREESHRQLMLLLALSGDRSASVAQYESTRRILVQELGIEPGEETQSLIQRIKDGTVAPHAKIAFSSQTNTSLPAHNLPAPTTAFVGREIEIQQISGLFAEPGCRLITLTGPGGIGKTRLALEFCWMLAGTPGTRFKDGIFLVFLAAIDHPDLLAATIAAALNIPSSGPHAPTEQLLQHLRSRQMLLVLDNFEHLVEAASMLVDILRQAPGVSLLVTSRHQLDLYEEWVLPVEGMPYPADDHAPDWQEYAALQLFQQRARRVNLRFSPVENRACILRLCRLMEGLPLGIELAAAWVNALPCEQIAGLIEQNMHLPESRTRNLPARQRSLQAVFQYSWDLLAKEEQTCLAGMALFQGGFTIQAAESVLGASPRLHANLVAKSLLRFSPDGRYELHSLLQAFCREKLAGPDRAVVLVAHSRYYARFLMDHALEFTGPNESRAVEEIAAEISNVRLGWQSALEGIPYTLANFDHSKDNPVFELISQYVSPLSTFYIRKSWFREAEIVFSAAVKKMELARLAELPTESGGPLLLGMVYLAHARHLRPLGLNQAAREMLIKGLDYLTRYGDSSEIAEAWHNLGQIEQQTGSLAAAEEAYQLSLRIYHTLECPTGIASNLISLGVLAKNRGDLSIAADRFGECLRFFEQSGDQRGIWTCMINLGNIANVQQDYQEARRLYEQAYINIQQSRDKSRQALTLVNLGSVAREVFEPEAAIQHYQESLRLSQEIGEIRIQVASLDGLGKTTLNQGDLKISRDFLLQALKFAIAANLHPQALDSLASLGRLTAEEGKIENAVGILVFVLGQPYCLDHVRQEAEQVLTSLRSQIQVDPFAAASRKFEGVPLETVIASVLSD